MNEDELRAHAKAWLTKQPKLTEEQCRIIYEILSR